MSDGGMTLEVNGTRLHAESVGEGAPTLCPHGGPGTDSLYFFDKRLAAASLMARADTRHRIAVRNFIIRHEYAAYDCRRELSRIECPTLVAVGRHDWICPVDQAEEIHALVPHSELAVFERSGHSPHVEEREAFIARVGSSLGCARATA